MSIFSPWGKGDGNLSKLFFISSGLNKAFYSATKKLCAPSKPGCQRKKLS
jgi:hypothetical protein